LEAGLAWGRKDGRDVELQAQADDATQGVDVVMGALENGGVIKLRVGGQAVALPMAEEVDEHLVGGQTTIRPGARQRTAQGKGVEHFHLWAARDDQAFDRIKTIEFSLPASPLGQIPTAGRGRAAEASSRIEHSLALEDATDGADARQERRPRGPRREIGVEGLGPALPECGSLEDFAGAQDGLFERGAGAIDGSPSAGKMVRPNDALQACRAGTTQPILDGGQRDPDLLGHPALRNPAPNLLDELAPLHGGEFFITAYRTRPHQGLRARRGRPLHCGLATLVLRSAAAPADLPFISRWTDLRMLSPE